ncbi:hypothetical protein BLNAU_15667 [Blattamonas nauphoetae]|uniref:Autophagy-related protein 2 n=1 Tax=Blattamonas nauphoetae TaxID=2049346 RepID=A0ABQ9XA01_9EUKA|nr:hypothetical protein BLNAU_15667 [Blattamonas nauphoetae]
MLSCLSSKAQKAWDFVRKKLAAFQLSEYLIGPTKELFSHNHNLTFALNANAINAKLNIDSFCLVAGEVSNPVFVTRDSIHINSLFVMVSPSYEPMPNSSDRSHLLILINSLANLFFRSISVSIDNIFVILQSIPSHPTQMILNAQTNDLAIHITNVVLDHPSTMDSVQPLSNAVHDPHQPQTDARQSQKPLPSSQLLQEPLISLRCSKFLISILPTVIDSPSIETMTLFFRNDMNNRIIITKPHLSCQRTHLGILDDHSILTEEWRNTFVFSMSIDAIEGEMDVTSLAIMTSVLNSYVSRTDQEQLAQPSSDPAPNTQVSPDFPSLTEFEDIRLVTEPEACTLILDLVDVLKQNARHIEPQPQTQLGQTLDKLIEKEKPAESDEETPTGDDEQQKSQDSATNVQNSTDSISYAPDSVEPEDHLKKSLSEDFPQLESPPPPKPVDQPPVPSSLSGGQAQPSINLSLGPYKDLLPPPLPPTFIQSESPTTSIPDEPNTQAPHLATSVDFLPPPAKPRQNNVQNIAKCADGVFLSGTSMIKSFKFQIVEIINESERTNAVSITFDNFTSQLTLSAETNDSLHHSEKKIAWDMKVQDFTILCPAGKNQLQKILMFEPEEKKEALTLSCVLAWDERNERSLSIAACVAPVSVVLEHFLLVHLSNLVSDDLISDLSDKPLYSPLFAPLPSPTTPFCNVTCSLKLETVKAVILFTPTIVPVEEEMPTPVPETDSTKPDMAELLNRFSLNSSLVYDISLAQSFLVPSKPFALVEHAHVEKGVKGTAVKKIGFSFETKKVEIAAQHKAELSTARLLIDERGFVNLTTFLPFPSLQLVSPIPLISTISTLARPIQTLKSCISDAKSSNVVTLPSSLRMTMSGLALVFIPPTDNEEVFLQSLSPTSSVVPLVISSDPATVVIQHTPSQDTEKKKTHEKIAPMNQDADKLKDTDFELERQENASEFSVACSFGRVLLFLNSSPEFLKVFEEYELPTFSLPTITHSIMLSVNIKSTRIIPHPSLSLIQLDGLVLNRLFDPAGETAQTALIVDAMTVLCGPVDEHFAVFRPNRDAFRKRQDQSQEDTTPISYTHSLLPCLKFLVFEDVVDGQRRRNVCGVISEYSVIVSLQTVRFLEEMNLTLTAAMGTLKPIFANLLPKRAEHTTTSIVAKNTTFILDPTGSYTRHERDQKKRIANKLTHLPQPSNLSRTVSEDIMEAKAATHVFKEQVSPKQTSLGPPPEFKSITLAASRQMLGKSKVGETASGGAGHPALRGLSDEMLSLLGGMHRINFETKEDEEERRKTTNAAVIVLVGKIWGRREGTKKEEENEEDKSKPTLLGTAQSSQHDSSVPQFTPSPLVDPTPSSLLWESEISDLFVFVLPDFTKRVRQMKEEDQTDKVGYWILRESFTPAAEIPSIRIHSVTVPILQPCPQSLVLNKSERRTAPVTNVSIGEVKVCVDLFGIDALCDIGLQTANIPSVSSFISLATSLFQLPAEKETVDVDRQREEAEFAQEMRRRVREAMGRKCQDIVTSPMSFTSNPETPSLRSGDSLRAGSTSPPTQPQRPPSQSPHQGWFDEIQNHTVTETPKLGGMTWNDRRDDGDEDGELKEHPPLPPTHSILPSGAARGEVAHAVHVDIASIRCSLLLPLPSFAHHKPKPSKETKTTKESDSSKDPEPSKDPKPSKEPKPSPEPEKDDSFIDIQISSVGVHFDRMRRQNNSLIRCQHAHHSSSLDVVIGHFVVFDRVCSSSVNILLEVHSEFGRRAREDQPVVPDPPRVASFVPSCLTNAQKEQLRGSCCDPRYDGLMKNGRRYGIWKDKVKTGRMEKMIEVEGVSRSHPSTSRNNRPLSLHIDTHSLIGESPMHLSSSVVLVDVPPLLLEMSPATKERLRLVFASTDSSGHSQGALLANPPTIRTSRRFVEEEKSSTPQQSHHGDFMLHGLNLSEFLRNASGVVLNTAQRLGQAALPIVRFTYGFVEGFVDETVGRNWSRKEQHSPTLSSLIVSGRSEWISRLEVSSFTIFSSDLGVKEFGRQRHNNVILNTDRLLTTLLSPKWMDLMDKRFLEMREKDGRTYGTRVQSEVSDSGQNSIKSAITFMTGFFTRKTPSPPPPHHPASPSPTPPDPTPSMDLVKQMVTRPEKGEMDGPVKIAFERKSVWGLLEDYQKGE